MVLGRGQNDESVGKARLFFIYLFIYGRASPMILVPQET